MNGNRPGETHLRIALGFIEATLVAIQAESVMTPKYEVIISWSSDDQSFIAEAPELAGCMADGKTHAEALRNLEVVMVEWIETATELGRDSGKARRPDFRMTVRLSAILAAG